MHSFTAYSSSRIFDGNEWLDNHAVIVEPANGGDGLIREVVSLSNLPSDIQHTNFGENIIAPAFMDLQIYGAGGRLLAVYPEADSLSRLRDYCASGGAAYCMPTVATNPYPVFRGAIDAIRSYWDQRGRGVLGLHIEGPWINPIKRGAHTEQVIHSPTVQQVQELLDYGEGVIRIITLAPECCSQEVIDLIHSRGIIISAGHSNATYEQARESFTGGIKAVTHLYNAMSPLQHRAPGLVGAAMDDERVMSSIIPDGHHVDFAAIRIAKRVMKERLFVITDAVTETHEGPYPHILVDDKYESNGTLSGSALTMKEAVKRLVQHVGVDLGEALRMCSLYPARVVGMEKEFGMIRAGYQANLTVLSPEFDLVQNIF